MKRWLLLLVCVLAGGCGVSKDLYQDEVVKAQEWEARASDLEARLAVETRARQDLEASLSAEQKEFAVAREETRQLSARAEDLVNRLESSSRRESDLSADLDLCRKDRADVRRDLESLHKTLDTERAEWVGQTRDFETRLENSRGEITVLQARVAVLTEEKERTELEKRERLDEISRTYEGLVQGLKGELEQGRITISQLQGKLTVNLLDEILFDSGSATVKPEGREVLQRVGTVLAEAADKAVVIEGHTDGVPITGDLSRRFPTNWELSTARATSVVRYLQEEAAIPPERLSAVGFGPYRPVADNETEEGKAKNRRIEIKLVPLEAPLFSPAPEPEGDPSSSPEPENSSESSQEKPPSP